MNDNSQIILYAVAGIFVVVVIYSIRDYIVIGLVSAGAIYLYKLVNDSNNRGRRR